ncbi:MAG: aldo/keto reductase [Acidobacteriota bacterium]
MKNLPLGKGFPALGLGTWKSAPGDVGAAVKTAIDVGYRHIDCAAIYGNEAEIGDALKAYVADGSVSRDDLWITSKLWCDSHSDPRAALEKTLADLRLERLDLYLIHWPISLRPGASFPLEADDFIGRDELPLDELWRSMEALVDAGLTTHIGVSNFNADKLTSVLDGARIPPAVNQVEMHPYLQQPELLELCLRRGVALTAYSPLGSLDRPEHMKSDDEPNLLEDPVIGSVARDIGATPAQVLLAWAVQRGTSTIPKSTNPGRLAENLAAADLTLSDDAMAKIAALDRHRRYVDGTFWAAPGSPYTVEDLWGE